MNGEASIIQSLAAIADNLVNHFDVVDLLTDLTDRCVSLLGASAAGVMLVSPQGDLQLVASSSEAMRMVELFELQAQEGPCLDAFRSGRPVEHEGLRTDGSRWPRFAPVALEAGFESVVALPMRLRERKIGALNLFSTEPTPLDDADVVAAQAFADLAAISIVQHRAAAEAQLVNEQLTAALASRVLIEQAKGVIFERAGVDMTEAFDRLRAYARRQRLSLTVVAQAAIDGTLDAQAWAAPDGADGS